MHMFSFLVSLLSLLFGWSSLELFIIHVSIYFCSRFAVNFGYLWVIFMSSRREHASDNSPWRCVQFQLAVSCWSASFYGLILKRFKKVRCVGIALYSLIGGLDFISASLVL
jgi:hypothetical protein